MEEIEKNDDVQEMKESLGSMMQMNTPVLDFVEEAVLLPYRLLMNLLALTIAESH